MQICLTYHSTDSTILEASREPLLESSIGKGTAHLTKSAHVNAGLSVENGVELPDDADDYELQQLDNREDASSPPPTFDDSMSDHDSPPVLIAATVTLKTLESPRTPIIRPTTGVPVTLSGEENAVEEDHLIDKRHLLTSPDADNGLEQDLPSETNEVQYTSKDEAPVKQWNTQKF